MQTRVCLHKRLFFRILDCIHHYHQEFEETLRLVPLVGPFMVHLQCLDTIHEALLYHIIVIIMGWASPTVKLRGLIRRCAPV